MHEPVAVTLVAGWLDDAATLLGARLAATTPGSALLHASSVDVAAAGVEVVAVDEEIAYRSDGCPCCAVRLDLVDRLGLLVRRRRPPARAIVVGLPGSDVATAAVTLREDPLLSSSCQLDGIVACVPGHVLLGAGLAGSTAPWPAPELLDAALLADVVWITDAATLTIPEIRRAASLVRNVNPTAAIDATSLPEAGRMLGLRSWAFEAVAAHVERTECALHPAGSCTHATGSILLRTDRPLDGDRAGQWIDELYATTGSRLLRLDAVLRLADDGRRHLVQGCRTSFRSVREPAWPDGERCASRLRIVGRDLDVGRLVDSFDACVA